MDSGGAWNIKAYVFNLGSIKCCMRTFVMGLLFLLCATGLHAQKVEQGLDFFFKPTNKAPRIYALTEKRDSLWHRLAYFLPETTLALEGWYKDADCKIPHGTVAYYHTSKMLKSRGIYKDGKKEGMQVSFDAEGNMNDSANYVAGRLKGIRLAWTADGIQIDSMHFDGAGNGVQVTWYEEGPARAAGYWTQDTLKKGKWKYYHANGQVKATEDYVDGKRTAVACYDANGKPLDAKACEEKEAQYGINDKAWSGYISRNLRPDVPVKAGAPVGEYTVVVQFVVNEDGSINKIEPLIRFGFGMEEEVVRMLQAAPRWKPAQQFGIAVKAYRRQPITFAVSQR